MNGKTLKRMLSMAVALVLLFGIWPLSVMGQETEPEPSHAYEEVVTAPTCTEKGVTTYSCACGESYTDNELDALGHSWGEWEEVDGKQQRTCATCGTTEPETVEPSPTPEAKALLTSTGPQKLKVIFLPEEANGAQESLPANLYVYSRLPVQFVANGVQIAWTDLTYSEHFTFANNDGGYATASLPCYLIGAKEGSGTISYTDTDGVTYSMSITVQTRTDLPTGPDGGEGDDLPTGPQLLVDILGDDEGPVDGFPFIFRKGNMVPVEFFVNEKSVPWQSLSYEADGPISLEAYDGELEHSGNACYLVGVQPGPPATITYTDAEQNVYEFSVEVEDASGELPGGQVMFPGGAYSQPIFDEQYQVWELPDTVGEEFTFYFMWDVEQVHSFTLVEEGATLNIDDSHHAGGYWTITVTVPATDLFWGIEFYMKDNPEQKINGRFGLVKAGTGGVSETPHIFTEELPNRRTLSIGTAIFWENMLKFQSGFGGTYSAGTTEGMQDEIYLAAMLDYGNPDSEEPATQTEYDYIQSVSAIVASCANLDDSEEAYCRLGEPEQVTVGGITTWKIPISAAAQKGFTAKIIVNVALMLPGCRTPMNVDLVVDASYEPEQEMETILQADDLDDADKLNEVLSSYENLTAWYLRKTGKKYDGRPITMQLPAVNYGKVIEAKAITPDSISCSVSLVGSGSGITTMPGLLIRGCVGTVSNICFVAQSGCTMSSSGGNSSFTCGILLDCGPNGYNTFRSVSQIIGCSFSDFDYGVRTTDYGCFDTIENCNFVNCGDGIYIDSDGKSVGPDWIYVRYNNFVNNDNAIMLMSLPTSATAYRFRVTDNVFDGNSKDLKIHASGKYYAYRNYFGNGNGANRTAALESYNNTIITNPRRKTATGTELYVDNNAAGGTDILNGSAGELVISGDSLANSETDTEINVLDGTAGQETVVAKWNFKGGKKE